MAAHMERTYNDVLVVFDFDCTLTTKHLFYFMHPRVGNHEDLKLSDQTMDIIQSDVELFKNHIMGKGIKNNDYTLSDIEKSVLINEFFGGEERLSLLKKKLKELKKNGCDIIIASYGFKKEIIRLLMHVGLNDMFDEIYGHKELKGPKRNLLNDKIKLYKHLYYLDDDNAEHLEFIKNPDIKPLGEDPYNFYLTYGYNSTNVKYNFVKSLEKNGKGLSEYDLGKLSTSIESSITNYTSPHKQPIPVNGTEKGFNDPPPDLDIYDLPPLNTHPVLQRQNAELILNIKYLKYKQKYLELKNILSNKN